MNTIVKFNTQNRKILYQPKIEAVKQGDIIVNDSGRLFGVTSVAKEQLCFQSLGKLDTGLESILDHNLEFQINWDVKKTTCRKHQNQKVKIIELFYMDEKIYYDPIEGLITKQFDWC